MTLTKRERCLNDLKVYTLDDSRLESYLLQNSNLPGRRANLECAFAFGDFIEGQYHDFSSECLEYCYRLISDNPEGKIEFGNEEFLPFCAIIGLGRIGSIDSEKTITILELLKVNAKDNRWRIRESVAMALQCILDNHPELILESLIQWKNDESYLVLRALVAGLANPKLMENPDYAQQALSIHKDILDRIDRETSVRDSDFDVLVKGLCYTLSVVITGIEGQGFDYLDELANSTNRVIKRILRENLKKNRLKQMNENKVLELQDRL